MTQNVQQEKTRVFHCQNISRMHFHPAGGHPRASISQSSARNTFNRLEFLQEKVTAQPSTTGKWSWLCCSIETLKHLSTHWEKQVYLLELVACHFRLHRRAPDGDNYYLTKMIGKTIQTPVVRNELEILSQANSPFHQFFLKKTLFIAYIIVYASLCAP